MVAITTLSDSVRRLVAGDLEGYSRQLDQIGDALRDSGWQGVFARQKLLTARRRRHADALPKTCVDLLDAFDLAAPLVTTEDQFEGIAGLYRLQVFACAAGD